MIVLVQPASPHQAAVLKLEALAVEARGLDPDVRRSAHADTDPGQAQASLVANGHRAVGRNESRVDVGPGRELLMLLGHENPQGSAHLRRRQTESFFFTHDGEHVVNERSNPRIDGGHGLGPSLEDWVGVPHDVMASARHAPMVTLDGRSPPPTVADTLSRPRPPVILPWKKSEPPPAFVADPAKAARYAEKAREAMRKGEWTYSLTMFAMSVKFDPNNLVVHGEMYDAAMAHHNAGGKAAASSDVKMIDGGGLVDRFAVSQYQWFCNVRDAGLALTCLESAAKAGLPDFGQWAAKSVFGAVNLAQNAKPNKKLWLRAKDAFAGVEAWEQALACGEAAVAMDASDGALQAELRQLQAALAIKRGGYNENLGKEGAFLTRVKDADKQAELQAADSLSGSGGKDQLQMEVAKREFDEKPQSPEAVLKYAQLLRRTGTPEGEALAIEVYTTGFKNIGEYRFKMEADNIRILRARRKLEAIKAAADAGDAKAAAQHAAGLKQVQEFEAACFAERASKYPTDRGVKYDLGRLLFELGRYEDAMKSLQEAKDEGKYRVIAAHLLGRCFVQEGWHGEAVGEFKEALAALDVTTGDREMDIRYDLMVTLIELAKAEKSIQHAKDAQELCSAILRKDIGFRDIRARRKETDELVRQLS